MEDQSLFNSSQPQNISEGLQNFINAMVEEIVLDGKPFDTQKKYLKKFSESEGLDYHKLEADITKFMEELDGLKNDSSDAQVLSAKEKGRGCYLSEESLKKLLDHCARQKQTSNMAKKCRWPFLAIGFVLVLAIVMVLAVNSRFTPDPFRGLPSVSVSFDATRPQAVNLKYRIEITEREDVFHLEATVRSVRMYDYFKGIDSGLLNESCKLEGDYPFGEWVDTGYNLFRIEKEEHRYLAPGKVVYFVFVPDQNQPVLYKLPFFQKLLDCLN